MDGNRDEVDGIDNLDSSASTTPVVITDDAVHITNLTETDVDVVALIAQSENPEEATHQCLRIGARAVQAANVTVDTQLVEKSFNAMSGRIDEQIDEAVEQIAEAAQSLLDEETGALPAALAAHRANLEELLDSTFDPESKKNVMAAFEQVMTDAHDKQVLRIQRLVTPDGEESPLFKVRRDIVREISEHLNGMRGEVQALSEKIAVSKAVDSVDEITTAKGFAYEEVVHAHISRLAAAHGDVAEQVGDQIGEAGSRKGDELIALNSEDTHGLTGRFVIEAKNSKLGMRPILDELDQSMENRGALAAIATFSTQEQAPTSVPFVYSDVKAIVVFDKLGTDDAALRLAYMWARWVVRRQLADSSGDDLDLARVTSLIEDARRALERISNIKRFHSTAKRSIKQASEQVEGLSDEVTLALDDLNRALHTGTEE